MVAISLTSRKSEVENRNRRNREKEYVGYRVLNLNLCLSKMQSSCSTKRHVMFSTEKIMRNLLSTGARRRLFPELYRAYRLGDLDDITFFLNRMYDMEFGERIIWEGSYGVEEELDTLLRALKLEEVVKRVDKELGKSTE